MVEHSSAALSNKPAHSPNDEVDLSQLLNTLLEKKWFIVAVTLVFTIIGAGYAVLATPIYKATAMMQVEESGSTVPGFEDMQAMFEGGSESITEIELLKSRRVIGEAVDRLNLNVIAQPKLYPLIGDYFFRKYHGGEDTAFAEPMLGADSYAWGGEQIEIFYFKVPPRAVGQEFILVTGENSQYELKDEAGRTLLTGSVGKEIAENGFQLTVKTLKARPGTEFKVIVKERLNTILQLQRSIAVTEKGKDSGILDLSLEDKQPEVAKTVLNEIAQIYVRNNVERNSAEAQQSLEFLREQLPEVKAQLEQAEAKLNQYQIKQSSVNISLETEAVLEQLVDLESKLQELELEKLEMSRKFKAEHPLYKGMVRQIAMVRKEKNMLAGQVKTLPETQQRLLRLKRDVEVSNKIYTMLLSKTQELDIVRAGTVGNVRIVDHAEVNTSKPVKPKKMMIVIFSFVTGLLCAVAIVLIRKFLHKGVEDPGEIEAIGLPVYATVPYSEFAVKSKQGPKGLLAVQNPSDLSIEALRSLRTSLHFAMMEAKNNVIALSGPSPGVGKSFVSANLAAVLALNNHKVLLIDADLRRGHIKTELGIKETQGLSDYLSGQKELEEITYQTTVSGLDVIIRGTVPPNPSELLMHTRFEQLIEKVKPEYDFIIVDTPPILAVTDPVVVSRYAGVTLLIVRYAQNLLKEVDLTRNRFEQNGVQVKGVVFNGMQRKTAGYNYGYYHYEYKSDHKK